MSHVTSIDLHVKDLDILARSVQPLGCELLRDVTTYKWYGRHVGDYPLPTGFTKEDMGKCDHVIRVKGADARTYEVGVVKRRDGKPGYTLLWDFYAGGYGLQEKVGKDAVNIRKQYAAQVAASTMRKQGYSVAVKEVAGKLKVLCRR